MPLWTRTRSWRELTRLLHQLHYIILGAVGADATILYGPFVGPFFLKHIDMALGNGSYRYGMRWNAMPFARRVVFFFSFLARLEYLRNVATYHALLPNRCGAWGQKGDDCQRRKCCGNAL